MRVELLKGQKVFSESGEAYLTEPNDFVEDADTDTAVCPDCGGKYLVNTGYCVSCQKKVADTPSKKESYAVYERKNKPSSKRSIREASETPDWDAFTKEAEGKQYKWDFFDYHSGELAVKSIAKYMRAGSFDDILED